MSDERYRILLVDDHTLFRKGLRNLLCSMKEFQVVGEASNGRELMDLLEKTPADVVLLDIEMPVMNGIEAAALAMQKYPGLKIIALSMYGEEEYYHRMVDAGVKGFLLKNTDVREVRTALEQVMAGASYFSHELLMNVVGSIDPPSRAEPQEELTERELEVLILICQGLSNQEIADHLCLSRRTVDKHREHLLSKTQCRNTANLVMYAIRNKLVEL
ncbi:MAG TPA: response regulator transcription factor [Bacteroidales bacterium]|nr:response regulator transcription factor [Bacteroidales bacterium]